MTDPPRGEGIVAVIEENGRFLMIQRAARVRAGGAWCFVGGEIIPGESQEDALVREVSEEVGLRVEPIEKTWECLSPTGEFQLHVWTARMVTRDIVPDPAEVADYRWLSVDEIAQWPDTLPSVLGYLEARGLLQ
jgi:8-oxo-dGTP pyrophosphatase MutT (NUDIX family)